jgi:hypothetical protein
MNLVGEDAGFDAGVLIHDVDDLLLRSSPKTGRLLSVPIAILANVRSVRKVHRTARIAL